jgi:hypothetical protein
MNKIIRMAKEAGAARLHNRGNIIFGLDALEHFAELIAAAEREACAKLFDGEVWAYDYREIAAAIRARGQNE